jgi:hypothetical protein
VMVGWYCICKDDEECGPFVSSLWGSKGGLEFCSSIL